MITKNDLFLLLSELEDAGVNTSEYVNKLVSSKTDFKDIIKFINDNRRFEVASFYEKLRASYNKKRSSLYINIVKEVEEPFKVISTLSAYLLQVAIFAENANIQDKQLFFKNARAQETSLVLAKYYTDFDLTSCLKLLKVIKADIKVFESIK